jgi:hypothetical protein
MQNWSTFFTLAFFASMAVDVPSAAAQSQSKIVG